MKTNIIYNEDCIGEKGMRILPDNSIGLVIADSPYNIGKADWDKIPDYIEWSGRWILECQRVLKDNGSFYWFHNYMPTISRLMIWLEENTDFIFKQFIVWNKRFKENSDEFRINATLYNNSLRNYKKYAEYLLFYVFNGKNSFVKMMKYLNNERIKAKLTYSDIDRIFYGASLQSKKSIHAAHKFSMKHNQQQLLMERQYNELQKTGYFKKGYNILIKEYEGLRYTFNNQKTHHSVWNFEIAKKNDHLTPKPIPLIENILKHSSNKGDIVLIPFVGSGNECIACQNLGRHYIGYETSNKYYQIAQQRLQAEKTLWDIKKG